MGTWEEATQMKINRDRRGRAATVQALVVTVLVLILMATAYFVATAGLIERLDMIPVRWSGDLAV